MAAPSKDSAGDAFHENSPEIAGLRQRKHFPVDDTDAIQNEENDDKERKECYKNRPVQLESGSYWMTRVVLLRSLGFVYCK